jgi:hypothetical protein
VGLLDRASSEYQQRISGACYIESQVGDGYCKSACGVAVDA